MALEFLHGLLCVTFTVVVDKRVLALEVDVALAEVVKLLFEVRLADVLGDISYK